jgi:EmrB/QacA subfamily drug resistance transporter
MSRALTQDAPASTPSTSPGAPKAAMTHRQVLEALSGLLLGMFVSILAGTVVSTSLPRIISDLHGDQTAYTWVVTSTLLATTVSTPIWGKLADLMNRKLLIQIALVVFVLGSALAGFSQDTGTLIVFRLMQGLGAGGLAALSQIIMADIISPRERGRYMGLFGAVMAVGMVGGPLIGGLLTDSLGWRWNFFVGVPVAIVAILLLQKTLKLPKLARRKVRIDYAGAVLLAGGVSLLLIWVSMAGTQFDWASWTTVLMVGGAVVLLAVMVLVEFKASEPIIPMSLFKNRTFTLAVIASVSVGTAMYGGSVFLSQYMQLSRGATPTESGLLTLPLVVGLLASSMVVGNLISRYGKWKGYIIGGSVLATIGLFLLGTISYDTSFVLLSAYMFILGVGVGVVMQNMVLIVQNAVSPTQLGASSSGVTFFRTLGGTIGVSIMGSVLASSVTSGMADKADALKSAIVHLGASGAKIAASLQSGTIPHVSELPGPVRTIIESVYGQSVALVFLAVAPIAIVTVLAVIFLPNRPLSRQTAIEALDEKARLALDAEDTMTDVSESFSGAPLPSFAAEFDAEHEASASRL